MGCISGKVSIATSAFDRVAVRIAAISAADGSGLAQQGIDMNPRSRSRSDDCDSRRFASRSREVDRFGSREERVSVSARSARART